MTPGLLFLAYGVIVIVAMYVFVYIPNKKKHKKMQELHDSIQEGDQVITIGGVVGTVVKRDSEYVTLRIDEVSKEKKTLYCTGEACYNGAIREKGDCKKFPFL